MRDSIARSGSGELLINDQRLEEQISRSTPTGGHHIGTTRMAADPTQGVVDRNCTMHGISNLHIAGAAVFPTCGHANPTLTIIALSVRLAGHVKGLLRVRSSEPILCTHSREPQTGMVQPSGIA
jgi:choline dehydrogenase-like flavoprotein